jgi:hypothetical protein
MLQIEATYKSELINNKEYLNTKYKKRPVCKYCKKIRKLCTKYEFNV